MRPSINNPHSLSAERDETATLDEPRRIRGACVTSFDDRDEPESTEHQESEGKLPSGSELKEPDDSAELSRREIARRIALEALRADRHVLETSAATAFRDFSYANSA